MVLHVPDTARGQVRGQANPQGRVCMHTENDQRGGWEGEKAIGED